MPHLLNAVKGDIRAISAFFFFLNKPVCSSRVGGGQRIRFSLQKSVGRKRVNAHLDPFSIFRLAFLLFSCLTLSKPLGTIHTSGHS